MCRLNCFAIFVQCNEKHVYGNFIGRFNTHYEFLLNGCKIYGKRCPSKNKTFSRQFNLIMNMFLISANFYKLIGAHGSRREVSGWKESSFTGVLYASLTVQHALWTCLNNYFKIDCERCQSRIKTYSYGNSINRQLSDISPLI